MDNIIAAVLLILFAGAMLFLSYRGYKKAKAQKDAKASTGKRLGATTNATLKHVNGLPIAADLPVEVYYGPERIAFVTSGQEISLSMDKITSIDLVTGRGSARKAVSGAAAGKYVVGGATGAAVGALSSISTLLIISYIGDGKSKSITLDASTGGMFPSKIAKDFQKNHAKARTKQEL